LRRPPLFAWLAGPSLAAPARETMKQRKPLLLLPLLSVLISAGPGHGVALDRLVDGVQKRLDDTGDFTARVEQEVVLASANRTLRATGSVAFKRPGRMRWELEDSERQIIVADGEFLWFYQPEDEQVIKSPFSAAFRSSTPVSFLTGVGRIREDFEVSLAGEQDGRAELALKPRAAESDLGRLRLTVDTASYDIVQAEVRDALGNVTRLRFSGLERNVDLDDSLFRFRIPSGVDVIEAPIGGQ
jgi:outer membrane lipoprotein carrier protein